MGTQEFQQVWSGNIHVAICGNCFYTYCMDTETFERLTLLSEGKRLRAIAKNKPCCDEPFFTWVYQAEPLTLEEIRKWKYEKE